MCIIIDTNKISYFFNNPRDKDTKPIHNWLDKRKGVVICTMYDKHEEELNKNNSAKTKLQVLLDDGRARLIDKTKVEAERKKIETINCKSNDAHILALARAGGARLLYSADKDLKSDFKNKDIINNPGGSVYSNRSHQHLLDENICSHLAKPSK